MRRLLGAVLAGGQGTRFGSDKALARVGGVPLIERALDSLRPHVATLVVCGRPGAPVPVVADLPAPGLGPLGGIAGALDHAARHGFDAVLTTACDTPALSADLLAALLAHDCAHAAEAPTVALWPVRLAQPLREHLAAGGARSIRRWAACAGAVAVLPGVTVANVNTPADLAALEHQLAGRDR
jgi:molybdopterin-guanine dinucleotide biosynthesis protein A